MGLGTRDRGTSEWYQGHNTRDTGRTPGTQEIPGTPEDEGPPTVGPETRGSLLSRDTTHHGSGVRG